MCSKDEKFEDSTYLPDNVDCDDHRWDVRWKHFFKTTTFVFGVTQQIEIFIIES